LSFAFVDLWRSGWWVLVVVGRGGVVGWGGWDADVDEGETEAFIMSKLV
jgi:hypothetical protein